MSDLNQIKRDLLDGAVVENVENIKGRTPSVQRRARPARASVRTFATLAVPIAVVALALVVLRGGSAPAPVQAEAQTPEAQVATASEDPALAADQLRFAPPVDIDPGAIPLEIRKIIIDPGHGGTNTGTASDGLVEKELTLDIAQRVRDLLVRDGFEIAMTRESDAQVELQERVTFANDQKGDLFLSIHVNWISDRSVRGVETFYLGATDDPELNALARKENFESGYSMADFKTLLEGIYVDAQQHHSRSLASAVHRSLYSSLLTSNPNLRNRGVKTAPFVVLIGNQMPAILAEVACLSNAKDAELLAKPRYLQFIAEALAEGVRKFASGTES